MTVKLQNDDAGWMSRLTVQNNYISFVILVQLIGLMK